MTDRLSYNEQLNVDESITSQDGRFKLVLQADGNLVLYWPNRPMWATNTVESGASAAKFQSDGNFVLYKDGTPIWASNTAGNPGALVVMQDDGNLVVYTTSGTPLWAAGVPPPITIGH
jgi:hypothetical protein